MYSGTYVIAMTPIQHKPWFSMRMLLAGTCIVCIGLAVAFFLIQAKWLSRGANYLREDLRKQHRIIRNYEHLLVECQELRNRRLELAKNQNREYRQPLDQSLQVIDDATEELDHLLIGHSRHFRWIQINGIVVAYQNAIHAHIRLSQQLELSSWKRGQTPTTSTLQQSPPTSLFPELLARLGSSITGMRWLNPSENNPLTDDIRALSLRLATFFNILQPETMSESALELSLQGLRQELLGYESSIITAVRREIEYLWRNLTTNSEVFASSAETSINQHFLPLGFLMFILTGIIIFVHYRISHHLRYIKKRFSDSSLTRKLPPLPPCGIREIDDFERAYVRVADNFHRELQMNSRHIKAITTIWNVLSDLSREHADMHSKPSDALESCLGRLLRLLGEQVTAISLARILRSTDTGLIPMTEDYVSDSFRMSDKFDMYARSTGSFQRIGWDNSLSGWIARHAAIDPWTPESGDDVSMVSAPLRLIREFGLSPVHEQGLDGSIIGIRLHPQKAGEIFGSKAGLLILYFDDPTTAPGESDWMFMTIMAHQIVSVIDTAELLDISSRQRHFTSQLAVAREIQGSATPPKPPVVSGLEIDAVIRMAAQVGGDYYDFIRFHDGRLGVVIADVSGKDIPAALLTMVLKTTFKALPVDSLSPAQVLFEVNRILIGILSENYFVTMTYGVIDPVAHTILLANAGHTPVLHRTKSEGNNIVINIEIPGYPLGVIDTTFKEKKVPLLPGDTLLFFTDGVLDCRNEDGERFGQQRLESYLAEAISFNLPARRLLNELDSFRKNMDAPDDITVVSVTFGNSNVETSSAGQPAKESA